MLLPKKKGNAISLTIEGVLSKSDIKAELSRIDNEIEDNAIKIAKVSEQRLMQIGTDLGHIKRIPLSMISRTLSENTSSRLPLVIKTTGLA
ncbi:hypothetical protein [Ulvibacterium marinum]|uniref:Uncharacterized protein n=1 Tax=Ulvibacterium marinum TaxID=2419782 RepID=A0A3B0CDK0_9FLAO|nr:hypothetical protein [Ulvibacterium marinum]RKN83360.1 hypothetical protein D7Z94_05920 [Ulvibacterium marinum]